MRQSSIGTINKHFTRVELGIHHAYWTINQHCNYMVATWYMYTMYASLNTHHTLDLIQSCCMVATWFIMYIMYASLNTHHTLDLIQSCCMSICSLGMFTTFCKMLTMPFDNSRLLLHIIIISFTRLKPYLLLQVTRFNHYIYIVCLSTSKGNIVTPKEEHKNKPSLEPIYKTTSLPRCKSSHPRFCGW